MTDIVSPESYGVSAGQLRAFVERIEQLEAEKRALAESVKEVMAEAKAEGFDVKALRKLVALRRKRAEERQEEEAILQTYMAALGML